MNADNLRIVGVSDIPSKFGKVFESAKHCPSVKKQHPIRVDCGVGRKKSEVVKPLFHSLRFNGFVVFVRVPNHFGVSQLE